MWYRVIFWEDAWGVKLREDCREGNSVTHHQTQSWSDEMACQEFRKEVDAVFPEHISRLHRGAADGNSNRRNQRRFLYREAQQSAGAIGRYRTQPVTFDEIKVHPCSISLLVFPSLGKGGGVTVVYVKPFIRHGRPNNQTVRRRRSRRWKKQAN